MIIVVYGVDVYKEYLLPNLRNTEYSLILKSSFFHIKRDVELLLDADEKGWSFKEGNQYHLYRRAGENREGHLSQGDIFSLETRQGECLQLIIADSRPGFLVMEKFDLSGIGRITIGNHEGNTIRYNFQKLISGEHGYIERRNQDFYIQDTSANGIFCGGRKLQGSRRLRFGDCINIFGLQLIFLGQILAVGTNYGELTIRTQELQPLEKEEWKPGKPKDEEEIQYFNRAPRNLPVIAAEKVEIEAPPSPKQEPKRPLFLTIGPAFTMAIPMTLGCGMAILSSRLMGRSSGVFMFTGIITAVASAALGVFWGLMNIKYARREREEEETQRFNAYGNYLLDMSGKIRDMYLQNEQAMHQMYPSAETCCSYGENSPQLWSRNYSHRDFLWQRLGLGDIPFQGEIVVPKERFSVIRDNLAKKPGMIQEEYKTLHSVPVGIDLGSKHLIGLVGGKGKKGALALMHILAAQLAANNCYTDVKLAFVYDRRKEGRGESWECMKWLPHVWSEDKKIRYFASNPLEAGDVFFELANVFRRREENQGNQKGSHIKPYYVLFVSDVSLLEGELIRKYIYEPRDSYGFTVFLLAETCEQLPNVCEDIIENDSFFQGSYNVMDNREERQRINFDRIQPSWLEELGRRLLRLRVNEIENNAEIPVSLDFFQMYHVQDLAGLQIQERWRKNRTYNSMRVLIGEKAGNADCYLDIHEKYHGPHGLIAGTTGSGKSETLQTYILSLAVNFSPDDIAFFLIDFKGGGMANLFSDLPHLAGQISNLSGNQVHRAMISIKSENKRRQRIFGEYGVNNINSYTRLYKNQEASLPIPHLFIIIDEFAELKREEPEFMRELISVAQVGRSLGVHLILATQKPSGTVDDNIWSNSKFRLCLRVQDRQDSNDMLHKPDAAFITQAGRCYLQVGNDEIYQLFQSGYSGAPYEGELGTVKENAAVLMTNTGRAAVVGPKKKKGIPAKDGGTREMSQLDAVVEYLKQKAEDWGYHYHLKLWLPVLKEKIYLQELEGFRAFDWEKGWEVNQEKWELSAAAGMWDDPVNQAQMPLRISFSENGHHAVCGTVVSGKSTFVQTLLFSLANGYSPDYLHIYGLDFSSRMLAPLEGLPHVGGIIYEGEEDQAGKLFHLLDSFIEERKKLFRGGNYSQYVRAYGVKLPAILLVADNYANIKEKTGNKFEENFIRIAREGAGYGIYLLLTSAGFGLSEIPSRIGDNIRTVLSLEMGDRFKYMDVLRTTHIPVLPEQGVKGRGLAFCQGNLLEFQTALSLEAEDDFERGRKLEAIADEMAKAWKGRKARPIPRIPEKPTLELLAALEEYPQENQSGRKLPFAYCMEDASLYSVSLMNTFCYTIQGKGRTGKTNVMRLLLYAGTRKEQNASCVVVELKTRQLQEAAGKWGARYITSPEELFAYFSELTPVFKARNKKKWELLNQGWTEEETFEAMAEEQPVYIFLGDLGEFMKTLYARHEKIGNMWGFAENILEKGSLHNIYFFGCLNTDEAAGLSAYKAYTVFTGYKKGVHLGGNLSAQRTFSFQNIPYGELGKVQKKGIGYVADEEDNTTGRKIVIPLAGR